MSAAFVVYNDRMKSLFHSLIDYDLGLLTAIAHRRAVSLTATNQRAAVSQLAEALLSPVELAITLDHLSGPEQAALQFLLAHGGQVDGPALPASWGHSAQGRPGGSARPWEAPANPAKAGESRPHFIRRCRSKR